MISAALVAFALASAQARVPVPAPPREAGMLAWLQGDWRGPGTMFGRPSEARLTVLPALDGRFLELSWRLPNFEGRAFYRHDGEGRWHATWFDSRGISFPIQAITAYPPAADPMDRTFTANWGSADTERGRTIYRLLPDGRLQVTDQAGGRDFANHVLSRTN